MKNQSTIKKKLLAWYHAHKRDLPWRGLDDPYKVWVSEVMLQQTRSDTVIPYYRCWLRAFSDLESLAVANEEKVLQIWEGLGYYQRALNLHKSAKIIMDEHEAALPDMAEELKKLPGIGDYIAGAIASIAFGKREPALDGNGVRVLSRLTGFTEPVDTTNNKRYLRTLLRDLLPLKNPGDFNQAVMDLGSSICIPKNPRCSKCPLKNECAAFEYGTQNDLPVKTRKKKIPHYQVAAGVILKAEKVLIDKRKKGGLLSGLWEFPGGKVEEGESLEEALQRELKEELDINIKVIEKLNTYKHTYTHFKVTVYTFLVKIVEGCPRAVESEQIKWVDIRDLDSFPMGKVDRSISRDIRASFI